MTEEGAWFAWGIMFVPIMFVILYIVIEEGGVCKRWHWVVLILSALWIAPVALRAWAMVVAS